VVSLAPAEAALALDPGTVTRVDAASTTPSAGKPAGADPSTTITFTVTSGALTMSAPVSASLGSGAPATSVSAPIGQCTVTDARALASAAWDVFASETDFANGVNTITAGNSEYNPGTITTTGTITVTGIPVTLSATAQRVIDGSAGVGNNTASWNPTVLVDIPPSAVGGLYTGTLTQSVS
jgi:hypothetical protein